MVLQTSFVLIQDKYYNRIITKIMVQKSIYIDRVNIFRKVQRKIRDQPIRVG